METLCRRIILIDHGRVLFDGEVATLKERYAPHRQLIVHFDGEIEVAGADVVKKETGRVWLRFNPATTSATELIGSLLGRYQVKDISIAEPDLDSVVYGIYAQGAQR